MDGSSAVFLGIEGGGTRTVALVADREMKPLARREFGPGNVRLLSDAQLEGRFREISALCKPSAIGVGLAGARDERDQARIRHALNAVWPNVPSRVTHDLEIALRAHQSDRDLKVLLLSGTGSCCFALAATGQTAKLGGWGHLLGDRGSGYDIALSALKSATYDYDRHGRWGALGEILLRNLLLNSPEDFIGWVQTATKSEISALAPAVFEAAAQRDRRAREVLRAAAESLAGDAVLCARRLRAPGASLAFVLAGSVLLKQPAFARDIQHRMRLAFPSAVVAPLSREAAWGAIQLALQATNVSSGTVADSTSLYFPSFVPSASPTEQRNPRSMDFHRLSFSAAIDLMLAEEAGLPLALRSEKKRIERAVRLCSASLKKGGRIFYAGAGTSGRLGVLDASECPPTFRTPPEMVQGIMAGGHRALWQAVEGAEDNPLAGAEAVRSRGVRKGDTLVGIAASGRTPFVWGALAAARAAGAKTVLLHFNPSLKIKSQEKPDVVIAPNLGPEVLTGSTRLKCGTATKLVLNMISTISMVRLGKVVSNLMVDLNPSNVKLRDRAIRIVRELTGCDESAARSALDRNQWVIQKAWQSLRPRSRTYTKGC